MLITTISKTSIYTIVLPDKVTGQYWVRSGDEKGRILISIEGINNNWIAKSNKRAWIFDKEKVKNRTLEIGDLICIQEDTGDVYFILCEKSTEDRQIFNKYTVNDDTDISIGQDSGNDICYKCKFVSHEKHAILSYRDGNWYIKDDKSTNGTFVNQLRVKNAKLELGDIIFISGLKIIIGSGFIAINNPDNNVTLAKLFKPLLIENNVIDNDEYELLEKEYFYRSPRFKKDIETAKFKIDPPPSNPVGEEMPLIFVIGSSMSMGIISVLTLFNAIITNNTSSMIMGGGMLIGTLLLPIITRLYERKRKRKKEARRQKEYKDYLEKIRNQIQEESEKQKDVLLNNIVAIEECENRIIKKSRTLWERSNRHNDFLDVRLGTGERDLDASLSYQERKFTIDDDNLQSEMLELCEEPKKLNDVPISLSLVDNSVIGIIGDNNIVKKYINGIIIQLAALYSYDEVKLVFLLNESCYSDFEYVKWIPHVWSDNKDYRFIAVNALEYKDISSYLENVVSKRKELNESDAKEATPHYIIVSLDKHLASKSDLISAVLAEKKRLNFSFIACYDELKDLPKECTAVIEIGNEKGKLYDKDDISGETIEFKPDIYLTQVPNKLSISLSNTTLDLLKSGFTFPKTYSFLEMYGVGKVEHLNSPVRWKENNPAKSLEVPIGINGFGETFKIDLHEKYHGPHGLIAGMTGSGKSELIITLILSLATNFHPNEVSFILIDYKGGGMAKAFENLPHVCGIITNLDGSSIKRSLVSIESELKRRQEIFADTSKQLGVSNVDIYKYQKLFRDGLVSKPLPHLFIISDEFAELKTQQSEFMTQLVSAARIGRSLGVHLILATQKPSGVVDDQIWSNSKFRISLRVQDKSDSMDMLKRPDAAELTDTGRFYLQVGYNELFEMGQSAWAGASYAESDTVKSNKDDSIVVIDMNGHPIKEVKMDKRRKSLDDTKELDAVTEYLAKIAAEDNIIANPLWLPPIPEHIIYTEIKEKYGIVPEPYKINPLVGALDDPSRQRQTALTLPVSEDGNVAVYGVTDSGKTEFISTTLYSIISDHSSDEVNIYILDFASETLRVFSEAPQVGDVAFSYEDEKVRNLIKYLSEEAEKRRRLFSDFGGNYDSYLNSSGKTLPAILVVINNFTSFIEEYADLEDSIVKLTRDGKKYGMYFIVTSTSYNGIRFRVLQNFSRLIALQMNNESDYSSIVGKTDGLYPEKYKGRGLIKFDKIYEFQTAIISENNQDFVAIKEKCEEVKHSNKGIPAKKIPVLPEKVTTDYLVNAIRGDHKLIVPIGIETSSLNINCYPFENSYISFVQSASEDYQQFIDEIASFIFTEVKEPCIIFDPSITLRRTQRLTMCISSQSDCEAEIIRLFETVRDRNNSYKDALEKTETPPSFERILVIINNLAQLQNCLSDQGNEMLGLILEKGRIEYGIHIIIGEKYKQLASMTYEKWYKENFSTDSGIWVGGGISEQYLLKINQTTPDMRENISGEYGYSIVRGNPVRVKLINNTAEVEFHE